MTCHARAFARRIHADGDGIVLAIMAIASALVAPALVDLGQTPQRRTADDADRCIGATRQLAIEPT